jgi:hypothetical protein
MAWEIAPGAGRPNSGPVIDAWHVQKRSTEFQRDLELFESIPADRLANLHVADALLAPQAHSLCAERRFSRLPVRWPSNRAGGAPNWTAKEGSNELARRWSAVHSTALRPRPPVEQAAAAAATPSTQPIKSGWTLEPQGPQAITGPALGRPVALTLWSWH